MNLEKGEYVKSGQTLFAIVKHSEIYIEANLKETQMTNIAVGQKATLIPDSFPNTKFIAVVDSISPATGSEFSILPAQNASGNWVKVVQRLPVRLRLLNGNKSSIKKLKVGMTVSVKINTEFVKKVPFIIKPFTKIFNIF